MTAEETGESLAGQPAPAKRHGCIYAAASALLLMGLVFAVTPLVLPLILEKTVPSMFEGMDAFTTEPLQLPEEWTKAEPYSHKLRQSIAEWYTRVNDFKTTIADAMQQTGPIYDQITCGDHIDETTWSLIRTSLTPLDPYFDAALPMARRPDFDLQAVLDFELENESYAITHFRELLHLLLVKACLLLHDEQPVKATEVVATLVLFLKREEAADPILQWHARTLQLDTANVIRQITEQTSDSASLEKLLVNMSLVAPSVNPPLRLKNEHTQWNILTLLAEVRRSQRRGGSVIIEDGRPMSWYMDLERETVLRRDEEMYRNAPEKEKDRLKKRYESNLEYYEGGYPLAIRVLLNSSARVRTAVFANQRFQYGWFRKYEVPLVAFDLARLAVATKLSSLNGLELNTSPTSASAFMPVQPVDPCSPTRAPYKWNKVLHQHYGVGRNGLDESMRDPSDPDNNYRTGDLFLPIPPDRRGRI